MIEGRATVTHPDEGDLPWWVRECEEGESALRMRLARALIDGNHDKVLDDAIDFLFERLMLGELKEDDVFKRQALELAAETLHPYSARAAGLRGLDYRYLVRRFGMLAFTTETIVALAGVIDEKRRILS